MSGNYGGKIHRLRLIMASSIAIPGEAKDLL